MLLTYMVATYCMNSSANSNYYTNLSCAVANVLSGAKTQPKLLLVAFREKAAAVSC